MIVKAGRDRLEELEPLWHALCEHHASLAPELGPLRERADSWARRRAFYEEQLAKPGSFVLIAERGGRAVGYALVAPTSPSSTWRIEGGAMLETIVLLPEARRAGLGSALMDRLVAELRGAGVRHLGLSVVAANEDAQRFYRRYGFRPAFVEMLARL